jgi:uncharacterized protein (DUF2141 family)
MKKIGLLFFMLPFFAIAQHTLNVSVEGVTTSLGTINIALYNQEEGFLKFDRAFSSDSTIAKRGTTEITIKDLPDGEYALALFHDENSNNILDVNWLGIPKETVGFSNAKMKTFGPPSYKECLFRVTSNQSITIAL